MALKARKEILDLIEEVQNIEELMREVLIERKFQIL